MFVFKDKLSTDNLDQVKKHMIPKRTRIITIIQFIAFSLLALFLYTSGDRGNAATLFILALALAVIPRIRINLALKRQKRRLQELYGTDEIDVENIFQDDKIIVKNLTSGGEAAFQYKDIVKFKESNDLIYLSSRENQYLVIDKNKLQAGEKERFIEFMKGKDTSIKW